MCVCVCVQMSVTCKHDMSCLSVSVLTAKRDIVSYFVNSFSCCERAMLYCWQNSVTSVEIYHILLETIFFLGGGVEFNTNCDSKPDSFTCVSVLCFLSLCHHRLQYFSCVDNELFSCKYCKVDGDKL